MEVEGGEGGAVEGGDADMRDASADESGEKGGGEAGGSAVGGETIAHAAEPFTADGGEGGGGEGGGGEVEGGILAAAELPRGGSRHPAAEAHARGEYDLARALSASQHPAKEAYERGDYEAARALAKGGDTGNAAEGEDCEGDGTADGAIVWHSAINPHLASYIASEEEAAELEKPSHLQVKLSTEQLKRLCKANEMHCSTKATRDSEIRVELITRLKSAWTHGGAPGPCPRCSSILHVVSDDGGLRLECMKWTMQRGGGGRRQPCGAYQGLDTPCAARLAYRGHPPPVCCGRLLRAGHGGEQEQAAPLSADGLGRARPAHGGGADEIRSGEEAGRI
jgi:hypothetical protein